MFSLVSVVSSRQDGLQDLSFFDTVAIRIKPLKLPISHFLYIGNGDDRKEISMKGFKALDRKKEYQENKSSWRSSNINIPLNFI